jgi:hypothetical protein
MKKYVSKYSNNKEVTAAQYITEMICENKAKKDKTDLHYRFWTNKKWSFFYRNQITSANKLLEKYSDKAIIRALKEQYANNIYSLRAPHLIPIIELQEKILASENKELTIDLTRIKDVKFEQSNKKSFTKNIINKLKDLDNER